MGFTRVTEKRIVEEAGAEAEGRKGVCHVGGQRRGRQRRNMGTGTRAGVGGRG